MEQHEAALREAAGLQKKGLWSEALELLDALEPPLAFTAHQMRGRSLWRLSRIRESEGAFRAALSIAEAGGDREQQASGNMSLGAALFEQSRYLEAVESLQKSISFFGNHDSDGLANALNWLAQTYHHMDLFDLAAQTFTRGLEVCAGLGNREIEAYLRSNSGLMQMSIGDNAAAEESFRKALDLNRKTGNPYGTADTLSNIGIALHADERFGEAEPWLREGAAAHAALGALHKEIMVSLYRADVLRELGRREEALELLQAGVGRIDENLTSYMRVQICALAFEQYMEMGMRGEASAVLGDLERFLGEHEKSLSNSARLHRYKARMAHVEGDIDGVYEHLQKSLELQYEVSRKQNALFSSYLSMHEQVMRSRMEAKLARAQKYESLGILTAGIAHDFNNSLHAILGNVEGLVGSCNPEERIERIRRAVADSADLCRQLLAFAGHASMNPEIVDLNAAIGEVLPFIAPLAGDIAIRWEPCGGLPPVEVDPVQLKHWVVGLVTRAIEALEGKGEITVSTTVEPPEVPGEEERPSFRVVDRGPGIPRESLDRVFDPFFHPSAGAGRGMDLAAIRGSVESIGGAVRVWSDPGVGTEFAIVLRAARVREAAAPPDPPEVFSEGCRIALVDDDEKVRTVTGSMLETLGFRVFCWSGGEPFLADLASGARPVCVLLDMTMPSLTGSQVFVKMREMGVMTPVILMSGFSSKESMAHFGEEMPACFLQKPFTIMQLRKALNQALGADATTCRS